MSTLVLATGHQIPVEPGPDAAHENLQALIESGEEWAFSTVTGAWFKLGAVVAILPSEPVSAPAPRKAAKRASSAKKKARS